MKINYIFYRKGRVKFTNIVIVSDFLSSIHNNEYFVKIS